MLFYTEENKKYQTFFYEMKELLKATHKSQDKMKSKEEKLFDYWMDWCNKLLDLEAKLTNDYFIQTSLENLKRENN